MNLGEIYQSVDEYMREDGFIVAPFTRIKIINDPNMVAAGMVLDFYNTIVILNNFTQEELNTYWKEV